MSDLPPPAPQQPDPFGPGYSPYPGPTHPTYPQQPPPDRSEKQATWALVLAIIPICVTWIPAVVLSIVVLNKPHGGRFNGRGKAIASLCVVGAWVLVSIGLVVVGLLAEPDRDDDGNLTTSGTVTADNLRVGDCGNGFTEEFSTTGDVTDVRTIDVLPCGTSHREEVYARFDLPDVPYPGQDEVLRLADGGCLERIQGFLGAPPAADSPIRYAFLFPTDSTWSAGRAVTCVVVTPDETTGSLEGSLAPE